jgi:diguanylate cyclase (GGDEF)-like protein
MILGWDRHGPREDERVIAGKVAGALWLTVLPMLVVALLLPGAVTDHWELVVSMTLPGVAWGAACLFFIDWNRVPTPLFFHVPSAIALPYIALLVALTGVTRSPFSLTLLMLLAFAACFFAPRTAIFYVAACVVVQALPLAYDAHALEAGLAPQTWVALFVFGSVGAVIMIGKRELLSLRDQARDLSLRDSLTGLANRRALAQLLEEWRPERPRTAALGLLLIDLDDFKEANTLHGLPGGDRVLCAVADSLRDVAVDGDTVVRIGGDEFAIVAPDMTRRGMRRIAARALESVREAGIALDMPGLHLSASVGWAVVPDDADSVHDLLNVADLALRAAKIKGKDRVEAPVDWAPDSAQYG